MAKQNKIVGTDDNWENGALGRDEEFAQIAKEVSMSEFDEMLELQMISIRLPKGMIQDLKMIAKENGLGGYQPLIRRVMQRFIEAEFKMMAWENAKEDDSADVQQEVSYESSHKVAVGC